MSTIIISCGGTGGHLTPGIAVAESLAARGHRCALIISQKRVDERLAEKYPTLEIIRAPGKPFSLNPVKLLLFVQSQLASLFFFNRQASRIKPDAILAFGGFLTLGAAIAATLRAIPFAIHEANRRPGKAMRLLAGLANRIYLPDGMRIPGKLPDSTRHLGFPVRHDLVHSLKADSRMALGITQKGRHLVVLGGSQGAVALNQWVARHEADFAAEGINVYCLTGLQNGKAEEKILATPDGQEVAIRYVPFTDDMGTILSSADLVVSRAGAGTIAEMIHCHVPSILVPYPYAADDHQTYNAKFLEQQGASLMLAQERVGELFREVFDLIFNDWLLSRFRQNLIRLERPDPADAIARDLEQLIAESKQPKSERSARRSAHATV